MKTFSFHENAAPAVVKSQIDMTVLCETLILNEAWKLPAFSPPRAMKTHHRLAGVFLPAFAALTALHPALCRGDFSGEDSLAVDSGNWAEFPEHDNKGRFKFQNSRLEHVKEGRAILYWKPNRGTLKQSWFIQVDVNTDNDQANLGVFKGGDHDKGYVIGMNSHGFGTGTYKGYKSQYSVSTLHRATLRMHFDPQTKTLTSSWKTRGAWSYFEPEDIDDWQMDSDGRFVAILVGGVIQDASDKKNDYPPYYSSGGQFPVWQIYYTHFKCGNTSPDMTVEEPAWNDLEDGVSKRSFGRAEVRDEGLTRTFTIRNSGTAALEGLRLLKDGGNPRDFKVTALEQKRLAPGESTTFEVTFKPTATGLRKAAIHIIGNDPDASPFDFTLSGRGMAPDK